MTDFGREYGEGLYSLCAEEGLALDVLQEMRCLKEEFPNRRGCKSRIRR